MIESWIGLRARCAKLSLHNTLCRCLEMISLDGWEWELHRPRLLVRIVSSTVISPASFRMFSFHKSGCCITCWRRCTSHISGGAAPLFTLKSDPALCFLRRLWFFAAFSYFLVFVLTLLDPLLPSTPLPQNMSQGTVLHRDLLPGSNRDNYVFAAKHILDPGQKSVQFDLFLACRCCIPTHTAVLVHAKGCAGKGVYHGIEVWYRGFASGMW